MESGRWHRKWFEATQLAKGGVLRKRKTQGCKIGLFHVKPRFLAFLGKSGRSGRGAIRGCPGGSGSPPGPLHPPALPAWPSCGLGFENDVPVASSHPVFPSDWCEGARPTAQCSPAQWASRPGCVASSKFLSLSCSAWRCLLSPGLWGAVGELWPCVFKMQFHLLPPPLWLGPPPRSALAVPHTCLSVSRHKGHLRKALLVLHRQNSGRVMDWLPPGFQSRRNPLTHPLPPQTH